jgi:prepilin-type N-terminal cleavage/methylation domain-containing protein
MKDRRGFTLVEILIVVSILALLAALVVPKVQEARARARAADVLGSMRAIRVAATIYFDSAGTWPPTAAVGVIPPSLRGYLPVTVKFVGNGYRLRWRRINVTSGGRTTTIGNLVVQTSDRLLCPPIGSLLGGPSATLAVNCAAATGRVAQNVER